MLGLLMECVPKLLLLHLFPLTSGTIYVEGDVVHIGVTRFKCRGLPGVGHCNTAAYQPALEAGIGDYGFKADGICPPV